MQQEILKIAMLGHKRIPSREGGIEVVVEALCTRMVALGHKVTCYNRAGHHVSGKEYDQTPIKEYKGIQIKTVYTIDKKGLAAITASISAAVCAALGNYDVVHFHAEGPCAMIWLPKVFGKRCIATIHGLDHQRTKWGKLASRYIMFGEKCAAKYADEIIVLSEGVQKYFEDCYGRKTQLIPNGVCRPCIRKAHKITDKWNLESRSYILFVGRLVPEKGIHYLIEAYKQICTDKKLVIAGGTSDSEEYSNHLHTLANSDNRIIFTDFVQGEMLEELYSNAYIYVLPSDLEGMPLTLLEAMSYGNCCLVSDISECTDVVEEHATHFHKGNCSELKEMLQKLCDNNEMVQKYREGAADYICQKYNWDDVVLQTLNLYKKEGN